MTSHGVPRRRRDLDTDLRKPQTQDRDEWREYLDNQQIGWAVGFDN